MMGQQKTMVMKRTLVLLAAMLAALMAASGVAFAVSKVCPTGTTLQNPCSGTTGIDTLIGTSGPDYMRGLAGNDKISGGGGNDTTDGGGGNDTYSYKQGFGTDTLIDASGSADHLNFSAVTVSDVWADLVPEAGNNHAQTEGGQLNLASGTMVEKVTGTSSFDNIYTGGAANTLRPGPGTGGAFLSDLGGGTFGGASIPASSDTYAGFAASGYGNVVIEDWAGTADKLVLPFASTDAYFEAHQADSDAPPEDLLIATSATDSVYIFAQLEPTGNIKGHIEQIVFSDETITIGSETPQAQTLNGEATTGSSSAEAQVAELNEASNLDEAEKERRSEAAKRAIEEAKQNGQRGPQGQHEQGQQPPDSERQR